MKINKNHIICIMAEVASLAIILSFTAMTAGDRKNQRRRI